MGDDVDRERRELVRVRVGVPGGVVEGSCRVELVCFCRSICRDVGGWYGISSWEVGEDCVEGDKRLVEDDPGGCPGGA